MPQVLKHPQAILAQTAFDLVNFVCHLNNKTRMEILEAARLEYKEPNNSWIRYLLSYVVQTKVREPDFVEAEELIEKNNDVYADLSASVAVAPFRYLLDKTDSTWNDESANTAMMKILLKRLPEYDPQVKVSPDTLKNIYDLFVVCLEKRMASQNALKAIQSQLSSICDEIKTSNAEVELQRARGELTRIREGDFTPEEKRKFIAIVQEKMNRFNEKLKPLKDQEKSLVIKRVVIIQQLLALDPSYNLSALTLGLDDISKEAIKVGQITAAAAMSEYITHAKSQENRKKELADIPLVSLANKEALAQVKPADTVDDTAEKARVQRTLEASTLCGESTVFHDRLFRSRLTKLVSSVTPAKEPVNVVITDMMRSRQAALAACGGLFSPTLAPIAESSSSPSPKK